jgi:hypothetical protein
MAGDDRSHVVNTGSCEEVASGVQQRGHRLRSARHRCPRLRVGIKSATALGTVQRDVGGLYQISLGATVGRPMSGADRGSDVDRETTHRRAAHSLPNGRANAGRNLLGVAA